MAWSPRRHATLAAPCKISDSNNLGQHVLCKYFTCKISDNNNLCQHVPKVRGDIGPLPIMVWYWRVTCYSEEYWSACSTASISCVRLSMTSSVAFSFCTRFLISIFISTTQSSCRRFSAFFHARWSSMSLFSYYFLRNSQECLRTLCSVIFVDIHTTHWYLHCFCFDGM